VYPAVTALRKAPQNAQNIKVWNTIIQQCMDAKKYKLAYSAFTDVRPQSTSCTWLTKHVQMKRRGFIPNIRTYATMMSGYATVDDWEPCPKQLELVHSLYGHLKQHIERTDNLIDDPAGESGVSFVLYPIALYISILGKAGSYQKAFDVFHGLDTDGPLAPHPKIYSSLLSVLADRTDVDAEAIAQSVNEAKYVWRRLQRSLDRQPHQEIEPRSVEAIIRILSRGKPSDHELMFDILRDICGLPHPDEGRPDRPSPPSQKKRISPTVWILNEVLDGCLAAGRPDMAVHYAQSVMNARELHPILRARHLHKLLRAHHILLAKEEGPGSPSRAQNAASWVEWMVLQDHHSRDKTTPNEPTFMSALELCHRCQDTSSALRIAHVVLDLIPSGGGGGGSDGGNLLVKTWENLFRLAATAASPDEKRQCLKLLDTYPQVHAVWKPILDFKWLARQERKVHVSLALHIVQVLQTVLPSPDHEGAERLDAAEIKKWSDLRRWAESFLAKTQRHGLAG
jgi:hypothetical protein